MQEEGLHWLWGKLAFRLIYSSPLANLRQCCYEDSVCLALKMASKNNCWSMVTIFCEADTYVYDPFAYSCYKWDNVY